MFQRYTYIYTVWVLIMVRRGERAAHNLDAEEERVLDQYICITVKTIVNGQGGKESDGSSRLWAQLDTGSVRIKVLGNQSALHT